MTTFIIRRLLLMILVLFGVSILMFAILMAFTPERRAAAFVRSPQQSRDIPHIIRKHGLDRPVHIQYYNWIKTVASGNLGYSTVAVSPVLEAFGRYLPVTIEMNMFSAPLIIIIGIWLGTLAGIHRDTYLDHITRFLSVTGWSLPTFLLSLIFLMIFYGLFKLFPPGLLSSKIEMFIMNHPDQFHCYTGMFVIDGLLNGRLDVTLDALRHLVLPVVTQVILVVAILVRVMRSSMIEEISKDYVITARAKGADRRTVYFDHARKNALLPAVTVAGWLVALSIEGSVTVEVVFNRPGMGQWLVQSATQLDVPVILSICMFLGLVYVLTNLCIDILYAYIDPRIRLS